MLTWTVNKIPTPSVQFEYSVKVSENLENVINILIKI